MKEDNLSFSDSNTILRMGDLIETMGAVGCLSGSCLLENITIEEAIKNLKKNYKNILTDYPILRLRFEKKDELDYWKIAPNSELKFENLIKVVNWPDSDIPESLPLYDMPHWRLHLSKNENKIKVRVFASHSITDGRCIFDYLELFCCYVKNEKLPEFLERGKKKPALSEFGRRGCFNGKAENIPPKSWSKLYKCEIEPKVELPSHSVNDEWSVEWEPIKKFIAKHKVTMQGILSASQIFAIHEYYGDKFKDKEIAIYTPVDARRIKSATEEYKNHLFQSNAAIVLPFYKKQKTIFEQIKHCQEKLIEALNSSESLDSMLTTCNSMDEKTGKKINYENSPDNAHDNIVFASHLGRVPEREDVRFGSWSPVIEWGYWPNLYAFHNSKKLGFTFVRPFNVDKKYVDCVINNTYKFIDFIKKDVSE